MVILSLTEKGGEPKQLTFDKTEVTVGRVQGNEVVLAKGNVSKRHCRISTRDDQFFIEDLKSTNGTYVNGHKINEITIVTANDKIYVGDFVIRVENAAASEIAGPPMTSPEAGSLGAAIRRPPPPLVGRPTTAMRSVADDDDVEPPLPVKPRVPGKTSVPPPPPPPKRDVSKSLSALLEDEDMPPPPPAASEIDLDSEDLPPAPPRLNVPPIKPVFQVSEDEDKDERFEKKTAGGPQDGPAPVTKVAPAPGDFPPWLRKMFDGDGASAVFVSASTAEIERSGSRSPATIAAADLAGMEQAIRQIAARGLPAPEADAAVVNVGLGDGFRLIALFPPVATPFCAAVVRAGSHAKSFADLVAEGALSKEMQQVLEACTATRRNVLCAGDRGATEVLVRALAATIGARARVVVIADRIGLNGVSGPWIQVAHDADNPDLLTAVASLRPDYLIADLTSPALASDVLQECALGQEGAIVSIAARSTQDALVRLSALSGTSGTQAGAGELIAGSFDVVVHATTLPQGGIRVTAIAEPLTEADGRVTAKPLLIWTPEPGGSHAQAAGGFHSIATSARLASTLAARGVEVLPSVLRQ